MIKWFKSKEFQEVINCVVVSGAVLLFILITSEMLK